MGQAIMITSMARMNRSTQHELVACAADVLNMYGSWKKRTHVCYKTNIDLSHMWNIFTATTFGIVI